jgi:hypothetical protein
MDTNRSAHICCALLLALAAFASVAPMHGCESLPGEPGTQGAVIGGATGAVLGAVLLEDNRLLGALIGGALGAGGGYLIGAKTDWFEGDDDDDKEVRDKAQRAVDKARNNPASVEDAKQARTADINNDGFVTLDEVIALERADFTDREIIDRLEATGQVFDLNPSQEEALLDNGVSQTVVNRMRRINQKERERVLSDAAADGDANRDAIPDVDPIIGTERE